MADMIKVLHFFLIFCLYLVNSQTEIDPNTDISKCSCDLTANGCDVNCCCDIECDNKDRDAFSVCEDEYTPPDSRMCIQEEIIWRDNSQQTTETTADGLFCIVTDNYEERNYYEVPELVENDNKFDEYRDLYGGYSFEIKPRKFPYSTNDYLSGDPVMTIYESGAVGYLGQPSGMNSGDCTDNNPVAYLDSKELECVRPLTSLQEECETNLALAAHTYFEGFKVISTPEVFVNYPNSPYDESLYNSTYAVAIVPTDEHLCIDSDGLNTTCSFTDLPSPAYDPTEGICNFGVIKVLYTLYWDGRIGINRTLVTFAFKQLQDEDLPVTQAFQTDFLQAGEEDAVSISGNPGYVVGLPVLAGDLTDNQDSNGDTRLAIDLSTDLSHRISIVTSKPNGECVDEANNRVAVNFGENLRSGCFLKVFYSNISDFCSLLQEQAKNALLGNNHVTHVATFGDSDIQETGDWVKILKDDAPTAAPHGEDGCSNIITGMHWEVLFANAGALSNAQAKITGVSYRFVTQRIRFQCYGVYCQPGSEDASQLIEIVSSVGFIDASQRAVGESAEREQINAKLPNDFFYPFS